MIEEFRQIDERLSEMERRLANVVLEGTVSDTDYDARRYRVIVGTNKRGEPVKTPWIKATEQAGWQGEKDQPGAATFTPYVVGQQVLVLSRDGEISETSRMMPAGDRDDYPAIGGDPNAKERKVGKLSITERSDGLHIGIGGASLVLKEDQIELKVGKRRVVVTPDEILTDGKTRLDNGTRPAHYKGGVDSGGDKAISGADGVFV